MPSSASSRSERMAHISTWVPSVTAGGAEAYGTCTPQPAASAPSAVTTPAPRHPAVDLATSPACATLLPITYLPAPADPLSSVRSGLKQVVIGMAHQVGELG